MACKLSILSPLAAILAFVSIFFQAPPLLAETCNSTLISQLTNTEPQPKPVALSCDLALDPADIIQTPIEISGGTASYTAIDCRGATLDGSGYRRHTITIKSIRGSDGTWRAPSNVTIRNCIIKGSVRITGMIDDAQGRWLTESSLSDGHTARAQAAAPHNIQVSNVTFVGIGAIPIYAAPGTTELTISASHFVGLTKSVAIYLDAESANNLIENNRFDINAPSREQIAIDGSANNRIAGNTFSDPRNGGVFLYRNCGERGTIRHQPPQNNVITENTFRYTDAADAKPAVWLGSRQGDRSYCFNDPAYPFGSSLSSRDFAQHNSVTDNMLPGGSPFLIVNNDAYNQVSGNR